MHREDHAVTDSVVIYRHKRQAKKLPTDILPKPAIARYWEYYCQGYLLDAKTNLTMPQALSIVSKLSEGMFITIKK